MNCSLVYYRGHHVICVLPDTHLQLGDVKHTRMPCPGTQYLNNDIPELIVVGRVMAQIK